MTNGSAWTLWCCLSCSESKISGTLLASRIDVETATNPTPSNDEKQKALCIWGQWVDKKGYRENSLVVLCFSLKTSVAQWLDCSGNLEHYNHSLKVLRTMRKDNHQKASPVYSSPIEIRESTMISSHKVQEGTKPFWLEFQGSLKECTRSLRNIFCQWVSGAGNNGSLCVLTWVKVLEMQIHASIANSNVNKKHCTPVSTKFHGKFAKFLWLTSRPAFADPQNELHQPDTVNSINWMSCTTSKRFLHLKK